MEHVVVLGAGIFGVTSALSLRARGWAVTLVDPSPLPAPLASSTDRSKVIRADDGVDDFLSRLAETSLRGWREWNRERFTRPLFHEVGFLLLRGSPMEEGGFEHGSFTTLKERGFRVERVDPETLRRRFPAWNADLYPDGYLSHEAGWAESGEVVFQLVREAADRGVELVQDGGQSLVERGGRVRGVRLASGTILEGDAVVLATGAWSASFLGEVRVFRASGMPVLLFAPEDPRPFRPPSFPVWGADIARTGWYGFPAGEDGVVKVGHHGTGYSADPDQPPGVSREWEDRCRSFLRESLPGLASAPKVGSRTCFYCDSRDGDFWIDRDPDRPGLVVATGGSGHGFKFAPVLGDLVASAVEGGATVPRFRWRPDSPAAVEEARYTGA